MSRFRFKSTLVGAVIAIGVIAFVSACSLVATFDGFVGPAPTDGGGVDASLSDGSDAGDAANPGDSSAVLDGGSVDANLPFCATQTAAAFCADFDEGQNADSGLEVKADPKAMIQFSTAESVSAPGSLHTSLPRRAAGDLEYAVLQWEYDGNTWPRVLVDFDIFVDPSSYQTGDINAGVFGITLFGDKSGIGVNVSAGNGYVQVGWLDQNVDITNAFPQSAWAHFHVDLNPATGALAFTVNGTPFTESQSIDLSTTGTPTSMFVVFGLLGFNAPVPAYSTYYDNVVISLP